MDARNNHRSSPTAAALFPHPSGPGNAGMVALNKGIEVGELKSPKELIPVAFRAKLGSRAGSWSGNGEVFYPNIGVGVTSELRQALCLVTRPGVCHGREKQTLQNCSLNR